MAGMAPLSPVTIRAWAELMDIGEITPLEIEGLLVLDGAMVPPSEDETAKREHVILPSARPSWPKRKER